MARSSNPEVTQLWQLRIEDQVASGMTVAAYCQLNGIQPYNFYFWRRKFAMLDTGISQQSTSVPAGLIPVRIKNVIPDSTSHAQIRFDCGAVLDAPADLIRVAIDQILISERATKARHSC